MESKNKYFSKYSFAAIKGHILNGIPASVKLAQSALESDYGRSELAVKYNNFFGIKDFTGGGINFPSLEFENGSMVLVNSDFRTFLAPLGSFDAHTRFLKDNPRYGFVLKQSDPFLFADELQKAGYATDPNYSSKIAQIINDNDLAKYDRFGNNKGPIIIGTFVILIIILFSLFKLFKK